MPDESEAQVFARLQKIAEGEGPDELVKLTRKDLRLLLEKIQTLETTTNNTTTQGQPILAHFEHGGAWYQGTKVPYL